MDTKKFIFIGLGTLAIIVLAVLAFASCNKKDNKTQEVNLVVWDLTDNKQFFDRITTSYQEKNSQVKITYLKKDPKEYLNESLNEIAAGKGPDIWAIPNDWLPKYQDKLVSMPTGDLAIKKTKKSDTDVYKDTYPDVVSTDNIIDDKIYGIPMTAETLKLFINSSILSDSLNEYRKANNNQTNEEVSRILREGPKSWDDLVLITKIITKKNGEDISQSAIALGTDANISSAEDILTMMMLQNGAKMTSDELSTAQFQTQQNVFSGPDFPGTKALDFYTSFANPKSENYTWNGTLSDSIRAFAEGKTAMIIDYESQQTEIKRINPKASFQISNILQVKATKNPVNFASYLTYTVTKASKNPDLAWDFINFFTNSANTSTYTGITSKPSVKKSSYGQDNPLLTAKSWYNPDPDKVTEIFKNMIKQVNDGTAAQNSIDNAASQVTTLLQKLKG